jgi:hypothetical protein
MPVCPPQFLKGEGCPVYINKGQTTEKTPLQTLERVVFHASRAVLTYLRSWALLEKLQIVQPLKNFPAFYGTRRFTTVFTRALQWSVLWARSILSRSSFIQGIWPFPRLLMNFRNKLIFYDEELLAPCPSPKLEDHPLSTVRDCLFSIFVATLHIWRPSPPSATWGRAMPWWQGTHLTRANRAVWKET